MKKRILSLLLISVITTIMITGCTNYETGTEKVYSHDEAVTELEAFYKDIKTDIKDPIMDIYDDSTTNKALANISTFFKYL